MGETKKCRDIKPVIYSVTAVNDIAAINRRIKLISDGSGLNIARLPAYSSTNMSQVSSEEKAALSNLWCQQLKVS